MAIRDKLAQTQETRDKIRTSQLINRLEGHVLDDVPMTKTQVSAALGLLKKTMPDLTSTALTDADGGPLQVIVQKFSDEKMPFITNREEAELYLKNKKNESKS